MRVFVNTGMNSEQHPIQISYSIGEVASLLGVSVPTLRLYDRRGLLLVRKGPGNQREYTLSDIERLKCIRTAISVMKISIEGIRRIQSLVPCWEMVNCPVTERQACPAYNESEAGCWTYKHTDNACAPRDCHTCPVYQLSDDCVNIKEILKRNPDHPDASAILRLKDTNR
jgi:MerR family transcriptional regulator, heat shock protein HspR